MASNGGLSPGFERYGGGLPALKAIVDSLGSQRGTVYDKSQPSDVYLENMAIGRAIAEAWSNNARMANQWDSARITEFMSRWEAILGIIPTETDTPTSRRAAIGRAFLRVTQESVYQTVYDQLVGLLGTMFVSLTTTSTDDSVTWVPAGGEALNSSAADISLHDATGELTHYSTVSHLLIRVAQPVGMSDGIFYQKVAQIGPMLDTLLPAWVTWDWSRPTNLHVVPVTSIVFGAGVVTVTTANLAPAGVQHGFVNGQSVTITGCDVSAYNGTWVISAVGGTTSGDTGTTFVIPAPPSGAGGPGLATAPGFYLDGDPPTGGVQTSASTHLVNNDNEALTS